MNKHVAEMMLSHARKSERFLLKIIYAGYGVLIFDAAVIAWQAYNNIILPALAVVVAGGFMVRITTLNKRDLSKIRHEIDELTKTLAVKE